MKWGTHKEDYLKITLSSYAQFINAHGDTKNVILWMEGGWPVCWEQSPI